MISSAIKQADALALRLKSLKDVARACKQFHEDERGSSAIQYALTASGITVGGTSIASVIDTELTSIFHEIELALCLQVQNFCILH